MGMPPELKRTADFKISPLLDPFNKESLTDILISGSYWHDGWRWRGKVTFKKGNTTGEQEFRVKGLDMAPLIAEMDEFIKTL